MDIIKILGISQVYLIVVVNGQLPLLKWMIMDEYGMAYAM